MRLQKELLTIFGLLSLSAGCGDTHIPLITVPIFKEPPFSSTTIYPEKICQLKCSPLIEQIVTQNDDTEKYWRCIHDCLNSTGATSGTYTLSTNISSGTYTF